MTTMPAGATPGGRGAPVAWTEESLLRPEPWVAEALCAETDPDAFFPEKGGSTQEAKRICAACDVAVQCLDYALRTGQEHDIWGGLSRMERRALSGGAAA